MEFFLEGIIQELIPVYIQCLFLKTGNTELSEDMCKEYQVMYTPSCETTRNTADIEESADGMLLGPEDLNYQLYDVSGNFCCFVAQ